MLRVRGQVRFWKRAPQPDSLEEDLVNAVTAFEDARRHAYVSLLVTAAAPTDISEERITALQKSLATIGKEFLGGPGYDDIESAGIPDSAEALDMLSRYAVKIDRTQIPDPRSPSNTEIPRQPIVFNTSPKGDLYE